MPSTTSAGTNTAGESTASAMPVADIVEHVHLAGRLIGEINLAAAQPGDLARITNELRRLQARCAGLGVAIARRASSLGDDPNATLLGQGRVSGKRSRKETKRAGVADRMPSVGDALSNGEISSEHVDAIANATADLTDEEAAAINELDAELAEAASKQPVDTFRKNLRKTIDDQRADHGLTRLQKQRSRSSVKMWTDSDGMGHLHITSDSERFAMLQAAIERKTAELASSAKGSGQSVVLGPGLQLDAIVELITGAQGAAGRPSITVLVDHETLVSGPHEHSVCETSSGVPLPITVVERYTCDGVIQVVTLGSTGLPLEVGRKYRTATSAQWVAIKSMYATCAWKGCDRTVDWCQAHHIHEWDHGGPTDMANLVPLCSRHHHMVHDDRWRLRMRADRTLEIHRPAEPGHRELGRREPTEASLWATTQPDRLPAKAHQPARAA